MLRAPLSSQVFSVQVKDHALILFLPQAEQQSLWRFDLDMLTEQAFCITLHEGHYALSLRNLDGEAKIITRFADKGEAHALLDALYDAFTGSTTRQTVTPRYIKRCFGWLTFWRAVFLLLILSSAWFLLRPTHHGSLNPMLQQQGLIMPDTAPPPPSGVPLDADQLLE
jgi:hypothetical protein